jgi:predicted transcriptional regulator
MDRTKMKKMKMVTLEVASTADVKRRVSDAFKGKKHPARISFASPELLWKVLTAKRWELLKAMAGRGPMTIRAAARHAGRDVKAVHGDVHGMLDCGLLDKTANGRIEFRFDGVHVDFTLHAA